MAKVPPLSTIRRPRPRAPDGTPDTYVITVIEGPDAGATFKIDASGPTRVLVGQSPACVMRLSDPQVSRRHASLAAGEGTLTLIDLGSTNGTTVNGAAVREAFLNGGETLRLGSTVLSVQRESAKFAALTDATAFGRTQGTSRAMRKLYPTLHRLAAADDAVLIEGEAGAGKSLLAEDLHLAGPKKDGPFVTLEASTIPITEIEKTLFGDDGLAKSAQGGTLYIHEIGNLPLEVQATLVEKLPSWKGAVRLIAATRRDLDRDVADGRFRDDLFFALVPGRIELPSLREREGDVAILAAHFWKELSAEKEGSGTDLPVDFLPRFEHYAWPANVRELRSAVLARMTLGELGALYKSSGGADVSDFTASILERDLPFSHARELVLRDFERRYVERILARHGGNVSHAASASGLAHRYFQLIRARLK